MPYNYINGSGKPRIICSNGVRASFNLDLPETNENGLTETWEEKYILHRIISPSFTNYTQQIVKKSLGWVVTFTFDYTRYIQKNDLLKIKKILDYAKAGWTIKLIPRVDDLSRQFEVLYSGETLDINIMGGGERAIGNKSVVLKFTTTGLVSSFDIRDPDLVDYMIYSQFPKMLVL